MQRIIFVDICNSLADVNSELKKRGYRTDIYPSPIPKEAFTEQLFMDAQPIRSVIELVQKLEAQDYSLVYLTARPVKFRSVTLDWLKKYGLPKAPMLHSNERLKGEFVKNYSHVVGAIEDSPHEIKSYLEVAPDMKIIVPDWEYNRHIDLEKIKIA